MNNVILCEDCKFFGDSDMGGEGWCCVYESATWYGHNAIDCAYYKPRFVRGVEAEEGEHG